MSQIIKVFTPLHVGKVDRVAENIRSNLTKNMAFTV